MHSRRDPSRRVVRPRPAARRRSPGSAAEPLHHPRREGLRDEPAQAPVVIAVAVEHVVLDQVERRRCRVRGQLLLGQRVPRVAHEALIVEKIAAASSWRGDEPDQRLAVDAGLAEDGVAPHPRERLLRIGAELGRRGRTCAPSRPSRRSLDWPPVAEKTLKLTLEWPTARASAAGPANRASGPWRACCGRPSTRSSCTGVTWPSPAVPTPASTRPGRWSRSRTGRARRPGARPRRSTQRCRRTSPLSAPRRCPTASSACFLGPLPGLPLPHPAATSPLALHGGSHALVAAPARPRRAPGGGAAAPWRARLHRVHAHGDAAHGLRPHRGCGGLGGARRGAPLHNRGGQLPAPHGADARWARCSKSASWRRCSRAALAARPA